MIELTLAEVTELLGLTQPPQPVLNGRAARPFPSLSSDSRTIEPGQCFIALKGARFDGHNFIEKALSKGARIVIHSRPLEGSPHGDRLLLKVPDTTAALQILAHYVRRKWGRPLIAITGSVGKTTTKEFAATLLEQNFKVFKSYGNRNNEIGVPLSLLEITGEHEIAVLELGMNHSGETRALGRLCGPDAALLANVAAVHLEFFSSVDEIAEAKGEILESLDPQGQLFFNADDPRTVRLAARHPGEKISFGLEKEADIRVLDFSFRSLEEMHFEVQIRGQHFAAAVPFIGKHFLYGIAAAIAVASSFGVSPRQLVAALATLKPVAMRGRIFQCQGVTIWDDSYNSSPHALSSILESVARLNGFERKILALGEMLELGPTAPELHRQAGWLVAKMQPALLVTVGDNGFYFGEGAKERGYPSQQICHFQDSAGAGEFLAGETRGGDFLLVKGSRGVALEGVVERIKEERGE